MRGSLSFEVDILNKPFDTGTQKLDRTAKVVFKDDYENIQQISEYGVVSIEDVYQDIESGKDIDLNNCYVHNFSLDDYRKQYNQSLMAVVELKNFSAVNAFFDADQTINFSYSKFVGNTAVFVKTCFGIGNVSFLKAEFNDFDVDFSGAFFGRGHTNFQYAQFGEGTVSFENATNIGNMSFVNTQFGNGMTDFRNVHFGTGTVEFHFAKFGSGDITFDKAIFEGKKVDFRRVEFGDGKLDFRRTNFGNGDVHFDESEFGKGRKSFKRAVFGLGSVTFDLSNFGEETVTFENAHFGRGNMSFFKCHIGTLSFRSCQLNNYLDLRVAQCGKLDLRDTIIRDVVDLKTGFSEVDIRELHLTGMRNIGKIIIDWKENKAESLVENQTKASDFQKAEQFRILKEEFGSSGQYEDEDHAYVKFKRYELRHLHAERLNRGPLHALYAYPNKWFQQLVFDRMGVYATNPLRVLISMLVTYVVFSVLYYVLIHFGMGELRPGFDPPEQLTELGVSFYHSAITFLTIGYGDYAPWGLIRVVSSIEGFVGLFLMSYFTVAFVRKILR